VINKFLFLFFFIVSCCSVIKQSEKTNNEFQFNYRAQVNLYSKNGKEKVIKKFYKFSNYEDIARNNINKQCLDYIKKYEVEKCKMCIYGNQTY